jgi:hypothetical protein
MRQVKGSINRYVFTFKLTITISLVILISISPTYGLVISKPIQSLTQDVWIGYKSRVAADPSFTSKSLIEAFVAASTQYAAELKLRGTDRILPEIDFVFAGLLTAVVGKYYSMWKTARTKIYYVNDDLAVAHTPKKQISCGSNDATIFGIFVPTNAFQEYLMDGKTIPTLQQRFGSLVLPMSSLARAGFFASMVGYGITYILIYLRSLFLTSYISSTQNVNIIFASLYTGIYMALVSNIRYQILQGLLEPFLESCTQTDVVVRRILILVARIGNGFLGSFLAISGMRLLGLQRLR